MSCLAVSRDLIYVFLESEKRGYSAEIQAKNSNQNFPTTDKNYTSADLKTSSTRNMKKNTRRNIIIKSVKKQSLREKFKAVRGKSCVLYRGTKVETILDFSSEIMESRRNILKELREKKVAVNNFETHFQRTHLSKVK